MRWRGCGRRWPRVGAVPWYLLLLAADSGHGKLNSPAVRSLHALSHFWDVLNSTREFGLSPSQKSTRAFYWGWGVFTYCSSIFRLQLMPFSWFFSIDLFLEECLNEKYIRLNVKLKPTEIFLLWRIPIESQHRVFGCLAAAVLGAAPWSQLGRMLWEGHPKASSSPVTTTTASCCSSLLSHGGHGCHHPQVNHKSSEGSKFSFPLVEGNIWLPVD